MNRLPSELHRLFGPQGLGDTRTAPESTGLTDAAGRVRAMVLGLARPTDWQALSRVWQGVQADLGLPAPAIAVAGPEGYQLWFSMAEPVPAAQAAAFLDRLRRRYLADIDAARITLLPLPDPQAASGARHATLVPALLAPNGPWSAFVAPDLAPMFSEESWLDMPPNPDGQADLLARLTSIAPADFLRALDQLAPVETSASPVDADAGTAASTRRGATTDPRRFLLEVMNDDSVALALRIEAAKALLPCACPRGGSEA